MPGKAEGGPGRERAIEAKAEGSEVGKEVKMRVENKVPPGKCDRKGQATVAAFRPWRGLPALNPHPLTA